MESDAEKELQIKLLAIATHISKLTSELEFIREEVFQLIRSLKKKEG